MNKNEIMVELTGILQEDLALELPADFSENTLLTELGVDSITMMSLWVYAEEKFLYETDEDALVGDQFETIGDIAEYILNKISTKE